MGFYDRDYTHPRIKKRKHITRKYFFLNFIVFFSLVNLAIKYFSGWSFIDFQYPNGISLEIFNNFLSFFNFSHPSLLDLLGMYIFYTFAQPIVQKFGQKHFRRFIIYYIILSIFCLYILRFRISPAYHILDTGLFYYLICAIIFCFSYNFPKQPINFIFFIALPKNIYAHHISSLLIFFSILIMFISSKIDYLFFLTWVISIFTWKFLRNFDILYFYKKKPSTSKISDEIIDPILDKIVRSGIESLTPQEQKTLNKYSKKNNENK